MVVLRSPSRSLLTFSPPKLYAVSSDRSPEPRAAGTPSGCTQTTYVDAPGAIRFGGARCLTSTVTAVLPSFVIFVLTVPCAAGFLAPGLEVNGPAAAKQSATRG